MGELYILLSDGLRWPFVYCTSDVQPAPICISHWWRSARAHSQSRPFGAFRRCATTFAHKRALPQRWCIDENSCEHDFHLCITSGWTVVIYFPKKCKKRHWHHNNYSGILQLYSKCKSLISHIFVSHVTLYGDALQKYVIFLLNVYELQH